MSRSMTGPPRCAVPSTLALCASIAACAGPNPVVPDGSVRYTPLGDGATLACLPNNDGVIDQDEVNFITGLSASVLVNPPGTAAQLDPRGELIDGQRRWAFTSRSGRVAELAVEPVEGTWFAEHFPRGDIAMAVTAQGGTLQVLRIEQGQVALLGLASREPDTTLTVYDPPVVAMRFPLRVGLSFSSTAVLAEGSKINGLPVFTRDTYEVSIKTEGVLDLPHLRLHRVLLLETLVTIKTVGGATVTTRQLQWFAECYGEVVRALSKTDEPDALFSEAVELRRLAL